MSLSNSNTSRAFRMQKSCTLQDFNDHPVADPGKSRLHQDDSFNWRLGVAIEKSIEKLAIEFSGHNLRHTIVPPCRCGFTVMKLHPAKLACIGEDERAFTLIQNKMIMLLRSKIGGRGLHFPAHAEMQAEPILVRKSEEHPLAARFRSQQMRSGEFFGQGARVCSAKNSLTRMQRDFDHTMPDLGIPLPPKIFHLRQFRHGAEHRHSCLCAKRSFQPVFPKTQRATSTLGTQAESLCSDRQRKRNVLA